MPSKILYDTRTNEILRCQPEPHGSASLPSDEALYRSARVPENDKQYMKVTIIDDDILTNQAQNELRIVNNGALLKPKIELTTDKDTINTSVSSKVTIIVDIKDTIAVDDIASVTVYFEDVPIDIAITDNHGEQVIDISDIGSYTISCQGDLFRNNPQLQVEVI
jgi:hypothetical protein